MFQFPSFAPDKSGDRPAAAGLPHSDTGGSMRVCRSPPIFAACRVLPRLWEPRYPPYALILARGSRRKPLLSRFQHVNELLKQKPPGRRPDGPLLAASQDCSRLAPSLWWRWHIIVCGALRKEIFQPHLPVRLPCYDLALVAGFTLTASFTGRFRSPRLPWLDGRCVQGPGTYSPRHS